LTVLAAFDQQESRCHRALRASTRGGRFRKGFPAGARCAARRLQSRPAGVGTANPGSPPGATGCKDLVRPAPLRQRVGKAQRLRRPQTLQRRFLEMASRRPGPNLR
jgi:hypothetical protein